MRILHIRFKNLNSLAGQWEIDFVHPAFQSEAIFAITGPTGAGKTTILDAICLALYGRTPRLNKVTKSTNEIMSRQTGECFAEVAFETRSGRFQCNWSQRRARRKADGELQDPKHEMNDPDSGKIIATGLRDVSAHIEMVTGLDFDRFTRSMLLAQGGFAAFLQAAPDERAPILEQITGTEIYSQISVKVHERRAEEQKKLDILNAELSGLQPLNEEQEQLIHAMLEQARGQDDSLSQQMETITKALIWLDSIAALKFDLSALKDKGLDFEVRRDAFKPELERLSKAGMALSLEADYAHISHLQRQQTLEAKAKIDANGRLVDQKTTYAATAHAMQEAESRLRQIRSNQQQDAEIIKTVRGLDIKISEKRAQLTKSEEVVRSKKNELTALRKRNSAIDINLNKALSAQTVLNNYIQQHRADSGLVELISAIQKSFDGLGQTHEKYGNLAQMASTARANIEAATKEGIECQTATDKAHSYVKSANQAHARLNAAIEDKLDGRELADWRKNLETLREQKRLLEKTAETQCRIATTRVEINTLQSLQQDLTEKQAELIKQLDDLTAKQDDLEQQVTQLEIRAQLLTRIQALEEDRKRLKDGKPCPLCGATEHPFAKENIPELDEIQTLLNESKIKLKKILSELSAANVKKARNEKDLDQAKHQSEEKGKLLEEDNKRCIDTLTLLQIDVAGNELPKMVQVELRSIEAQIASSAKTIQEVEQMDKSLKSQQVILEKARASLADSEKLLQLAIHKKETAGLELDRTNQEYEDAARKYAAMRDETLQEVAAYGIKELPIEELNNVLAGLTARRDTWQRKLARQAELEKEILALNGESQTLVLLASKLDDDLKASCAACAQLRQELDALTVQRFGLYGDKNADIEETKMTQALLETEGTLASARTAHANACQSLSNLTTMIEAIDASLCNIDTQLQVAEAAFSERLIPTGFVDKASFLSARLSEEERNALTLKAQSLQKEQTEIETRLSDKNAILTAELEKNITAQPRDTLEQDQALCVTSLKETQAAILKFQMELTESHNLKIKQREKRSGMESQKKECARWDALHELIGSADGKKYRNFAQGLTFDGMICHANRQLRKMTDRYLLIRDPSQPLELNIIDSYQAGEIRSTKNLSGGESFLVSLSLALGLSHMAGRNVRVDSLFLDEGFGTLDEDALETALETLAGLRQDGKLIGVISHVPALKERIRTQILVAPQASGRSHMSGPGCRRID